jgi:DNA-binding PadR family transcriptional regulator
MTHYDTTTEKDNPIASLPDLSRFQLEVLYELYENADYGLRVKELLSEYFETEVNHGRLYPNLDELAEMGLVDKSKADGRTNRYALTSDGRAVVEADHDRRAAIVGDGDE